MIRRPAAAFLATVLLFPAARASAHLVSTGFGPFYDGLAHPFLSPGDLLPVLALGVWAGLRGPAEARWIVALLPAAWLLGAIAGQALPASRLLSAGELGLAILLGLGAAVDPRVPAAVPLALAGALGLTHGLGATAGGGDGLVATAGAVLAVTACLAVIAGQAASLRMAWTRVGARALSSWTAAIGLLQLGWMWRG